MVSSVRAAPLRKKEPEGCATSHLGSARLLTLWGPSTRIQSSGGTSTWKYYISGVCPSVNGTSYTILIWVKNQGTTSVKISGNIVDGPTITPGTTQLVNFSETGNGTSCAQLGIATINIGDSFDIIAFAPAIIPSGGSNLIASANENFSGWAAYMGASVTLTQGQAPFIFDNMDYLPFGEQIAGASGSSHKFTGDERDAESNLDHTWFRQYSSSLGRWMHPDPAGLAAVDPSNPQSWNRYSYVMNNPLNSVDPLGLSDCPDLKPTCGDDPGTDTGAPGVAIWGNFGNFGLNYGPGNPANGTDGWADGGRDIPPLGTIENDCMGGPCFPFMQWLNNGCVASVSYYTVNGAGGQYSMPEVSTLCGGGGQGPGGHGTGGGTKMGPLPPPTVTPYKVTGSCMVGAISQNFFGDDGQAGLTAVVHAAAYLAARRLAPTLLPGPGWVYVGTALVYDTVQATRAYASCKYNGGPDLP